MTSCFRIMRMFDEICLKILKFVENLFLNSSVIKKDTLNIFYLFSPEINTITPRN